MFKFFRKKRVPAKVDITSILYVKTLKAENEFLREQNDFLGDENEALRIENEVLNIDLARRRNNAVLSQQRYKKKQKALKIQNKQ